MLSLSQEEKRSSLLIFVLCWKKQLGHQNYRKEKGKNESESKQNGNGQNETFD